MHTSEPIYTDTMQDKLVVAFHYVRSRVSAPCQKGEIIENTNIFLSFLNVIQHYIESPIKESEAAITF